MNIVTLDITYSINDEKSSFNKTGEAVSSSSIDCLKAVRTLTETFRQQIQEKQFNASANGKESVEVALAIESIWSFNGRKYACNCKTTIDSHGPFDNYDYLGLLAESLTNEMESQIACIEHRGEEAWRKWMDTGVFPED